MMQARILDCHDMIMALVPLVENPPWQRKRVRSGKPVVKLYILVYAFHKIAS